jgi:hypothetical protein
MFNCEKFKDSKSCKDVESKCQRIIGFNLKTLSQCRQKGLNCLAEKKCKEQGFNTKTCMMKMPGDKCFGDYNNLDGKCHISTRHFHNNPKNGCLENRNLRK